MLVNSQSSRVPRPSPRPSRPGTCRRQRDIVETVRNITSFATKSLSDLARRDCQHVDRLQRRIHELENCRLLPHPKSCDEIKRRCPASKPGYYTIVGECKPVYCDFLPRVIPGCPGAGWRRIAHLDMSNPRASCPGDFKLYDNKTYGVRACGRKAIIRNYCESIKFPMPEGMEDGYGEVCGTVIGYQYWSPNELHTSTNDIDSYYVDGISLTYGMNPRNHIWTFMAGRNEQHRGCPCANDSTTSVPSFIGDNYYCESGSKVTETRKLYTEDPLWDGKGCGHYEVQCCNHHGRFYANLTETTTDDMELRICADYNDEDIPFKLYDIYVK